VTMPVLIFAEFVIESDLCLPTGAEPLVLSHPANAFQLKLSNLSAGEDENARLAGHLFFSAESFDTGVDEAHEKLAYALSFLSYTTNRKFECTELMRVVDWTPGLPKRRALIYHSSPLDDRAEPALHATYGHTAERLMAMSHDPRQAAALRWYRVAIGADTFEQQFPYFFFALEIVAQALKDSSKVTSKCPQCGGRLYCESCQNYPTHRPYEKQAIRQLVERVHPKGADEVFETLNLIRNTLAHGKSVEEIVEQLPCTPEQAVNKLARITHSALFLMFNESALPDPGKALKFAGPDTVVRRDLVAGIHMEFSTKGDPTNPKVEDLPEVNVSVEYLSREIHNRP
jgi:hypothetical protein